jgi:hypothetical protein
MAKQTLQGRPTATRVPVTGAQVADTLASAYREVSRSWGGLTVSLDTLESVPDGTDAYAVSIRPAEVPAVTLPETASFAEFTHGFTVALLRFGALAESVPYLGIWHDDEHHVIELDPVAVVATRAEVDALGAIYPVVGGAYHFATGNGYYPNGRPS